MGVPRILVGLGSAVLAGCGAIVEPVLVVPCPSGECWDLSAGSEVLINDRPADADLGRNEAHAWRFTTIPGHQYFVLTRVFSGSADTYVSLSPIIDPVTHAMVDVGSSTGLAFTATDRVAYIAVADRGNHGGTEYTVRVVSYDERLDPIPGTTRLLVNDFPVPRALVPGETARFVFDAIRGADYTIRVTTIRGATETFASLIPSVDDDFFDVAEPGGLIAFSATETGRYYVAVIDRTEAAGSEVTIQITSP
ncbi:MAG: hypothetical protein AB1451_10815 [Nitrospirota bacterium]